MGKESPHFSGESRQIESYDINFSDFGITFELDIYKVGNKKYGYEHDYALFRYDGKITYQIRSFMYKMAKKILGKCRSTGYASVRGKLEWTFDCRQM